MSEYSFPNKEKLKSRKVITMLFEKGNTYNIFPLKIFWLATPNQDFVEIRAGFSVPKKKFKRAVDRNLLKRRMREAYRLNKAELISLAKEKDISVSIFFIFIASDIIDYQQIEKSVINQLQGLCKKIRT